MTKIFGILNVTPDSFSDGGIYNETCKAIKRLEELLIMGADFVDIGAQSTSYDAKIISAEKEWKILLPILTTIEDKSKISIDTFHYENILKAYEQGYRIFNDVKGGQNQEIINFINTHNDTLYVAMYSLTIPANKNVRVDNISEIMDWAKNLVKKFSNPEQLVIDPGIGFTTNPAQSFEMIKNILALKKFGAKTLVGHSRKSFLEEITAIPPQERDLETVIASIYMYNKVDYVRIHNVSMHNRAFNLWQLIT